MGARKRLAAEKRKEEKKQQYFVHQHLGLYAFKILKSFYSVFSNRQLKKLGKI